MSTRPTLPSASPIPYDTRVPLNLATKRLWSVLREAP